MGQTGKAGRQEGEQLRQYPLGGTSWADAPLKGLGSAKREKLPQSGKDAVVKGTKDILGPSMYYWEKTVTDHISNETSEEEKQTEQNEKCR